MSAQRIPLAGVIGDPISHSKSPALFAHWFKQTGCAGHYVPLHVEGGDLKRVLRNMPRMGFVGCNVTLPHKEAALEIADRATDRATLVGAANTLIFRPNGSILADNTDGYGFISNIRAAAPAWDGKSGPAVVLGAGGAARAILAALIELGVPKIFLSNRTRGKAEALRTAFGSKIDVVDWVQAGNAIEDSRTIINTTSLGMVGNPELRVPLDGIEPGDLVTDIVYTPLETRLLREAAQQGAQTVDGLGMLLYQAVPGFERWFGHRPVVDPDTRLAVLG
ncbi:MAG: shikimate dehydrogenase [Pseudomonadota bacterium]